MCSNPPSTSLLRVLWGYACCFVSLLEPTALQRGSLLLPLCCPVVISCDRYVIFMCSKIPSTSLLHALWGCVAMHCVSSHCSSLPPCSEMMFEQVTLIHPSFRDHTSHAVCPSISTCMCDAIQLGNLLSAGRALPAMADDKQPTRPWKRVVAPVLAPDWMSASVVRLEEARSLPPERAHASS